MAFLLAFAFGVSAERFGQLRDLARLDTDAIEDVYLMSDFLEEEDGRKVRTLMHEYHRTRQEAIAARDSYVMGKTLERCGEIHDEVWAVSVAARKRSSNTILNNYIVSVQEMMDTHTARVSKALVTRLPMVIWWTLGALFTVSSLMLGMNSGLHGRRSRLASLMVVASFSVVAVMIIDLDRPMRSLFRFDDPTAAALLEKMEADAGR